MGWILLITSLLSLVESILNRILLLALWLGTIGIFTKPNRNTFKDHVKYYFKYIVPKNEHRRSRWSYFFGKKIIASVIDSADSFVIDYFWCKLGCIRLEDKDIHFIGCLGSWYALSEPENDLETIYCFKKYGR